MAKGVGIAKVNLSNLPAVLGAEGDGATTVATTMLACDLAGIEIFVTGGIGGVHPTAFEDFDISADLTALGRFHVTVVSAGAKAILDIGATLEALETKGVPVIGYKTDRFPTFYRPSSEFNVDARVEDAESAARIVRAHRSNPYAAGMLIANPIPEADALPQLLVDEAIAKAQADAERLGIRGRDVTPFLLGAVEHHTGARSLGANMALLLNNAAVGAQLARQLAANGN
jgi:pseudouridine-5'-phosphate glycosidase